MEIAEEVKIFLLEGYELLDSVESSLLILENDPKNQEQVNQVFRAIHTIKGNSGFLGLAGVEKLCHITETLLDKVRSDQVELSSDIVSTLLRSRDLLHETMQTIESTGNEGEVKSEAILTELSQYLER